MKILKLFIGLLVLLGLIIIGRGLMTSSISYESEIYVDKPLKEAWAVMQDQSKVQEWLQDITDMKHVSGEKGNVGAVTEYTFNQGGQESKILETITSITPEKQIKMDFAAAGAMVMDYTVDFNVEDGMTKIKTFTDVTGDGFAMKCLIPWLKGTMITQEETNMKNLQNLINSNTTKYFPDPVQIEVEI